ncbi:MAG: methionine adenosyltransferase, partial [Myxococcales bacterium]
MSQYLFTSESVTEGHPDKICDKISDSLLDAYLEQDPRSRVAIETMVKTGFVVCGGEVTSKAVVEIPKIARKAIAEIGYTDSSMGFDAETCGILAAVEQQSPDIARGVDSTASKEQGAGDQGLMFGYAVNETRQLMPMPIDLSHKLARRLAHVRKKGIVEGLRPDGKTQVTVEYEDDRPRRFNAVVVSTQHEESLKQRSLRDAIIEEVIKPTLPAKMLDNKTKIHTNPTGRFVVGGPYGDAGLTGRKIIVDTY